MKSLKSILALIVCMLGASALMAQVQFHAASSDISIAGTSTLHDWEMQSTKSTVAAAFTLDNAGKPTALNSLSFSMDPTSLKSGKESMDDNAYKALKTSNYKVIKFVASSGTITPAGGANYTVKASGVMTIAGSSVNTDVVATCTLGADGTITCNGLKAIKMTQYGVKPPTFMMGTIKTGDDLNIKFKAVLKK